MKRGWEERKSVPRAGNPGRRPGLNTNKYAGGKASGFGLEFRHGEDTWVYDYVDDPDKQNRGKLPEPGCKDESKDLLKTGMSGVQTLR